MLNTNNNRKTIVVFPIAFSECYGTKSKQSSAIDYNLQLSLVGAVKARPDMQI